MDLQLSVTLEMSSLCCKAIFLGAAWGTVLGGPVFRSRTSQAKTRPDASSALTVGSTTHPPTGRIGQSQNLKQVPKV